MFASGSPMSECSPLANASSRGLSAAAAMGVVDSFTSGSFDFDMECNNFDYAANFLNNNNGGGGAPGQFLGGMINSYNSHLVNASFNQHIQHQQSSAGLSTSPPLINQSTTSTGTSADGNFVIPSYFPRHHSSTQHLHHHNPQDQFLQVPANSAVFGGHAPMPVAPHSHFVNRNAAAVQFPNPHLQHHHHHNHSHHGHVIMPPPPPAAPGGGRLMQPGTFPVDEEYKEGLFRAQMANTGGFHHLASQELTHQASSVVGEHLRHRELSQLEFGDYDHERVEEQELQEQRSVFDDLKEDDHRMPEPQGVSVAPGAGSFGGSEYAFQPFNPHAAVLLEGSGSPANSVVSGTTPSEVRTQVTGMSKSSRTVVACVSCHHAKAKCDSERPCRRCVKLGKGFECHDRPHKPRTRLKDKSDSNILRSLEISKKFSQVLSQVWLKSCKSVLEQAFQSNDLAFYYSTAQKVAFITERVLLRKLVSEDVDELCEKFKEIGIATSKPPEQRKLKLEAPQAHSEEDWPIPVIEFRCISNRVHECDAKKQLQTGPNCNGQGATCKCSQTPIDKKLLIVSSEASKLFGYSQTEMVNLCSSADSSDNGTDPPLMSTLVCEEDWPLIGQVFVDAILDPEGRSLSKRVRCRRKDNEQVPCWAILKLREAQGKDGSCTHSASWSFFPISE